jgi:hypothetical protein
VKRRWKKSFDRVGLRGRTEPDHSTGSAGLYGTGADVCPIDNWQRNHVYTDAPKEAQYRCDAFFKWGHLTLEATYSCYTRTVEEGKKKCELWLKRVSTG